MLRSYFKIAWRHLRKNKVYSIINITGLSIGLCCFLLLLLYVQHEISYDTFHENKDRIYRPGFQYGTADIMEKTTVTPTAFLPTMLRRFPEIETGVRVFDPSSFSPLVVKKDDKLFEESRFFFADSTFFKVFSFDLLIGDPERVLKQPNTVVLTIPMAKKYFGKTQGFDELLGESIMVGSGEYLITGFMEAPPANSHLTFDFVASFHSLSAGKSEKWGSANYQTYLLLEEQADVAVLQEKIDAVTAEIFKEDLSAGEMINFPLMSLLDIHLFSDLSGELKPGGNIQYVYIFSFVALLILFIACINYVNLATARAGERAQEVGVRKVLGAHKSLLRKQFLGEAAILTFIALILGAVIAHIALPYFQQVTNRQISLNYLENPEYLLLLGFIGAIVTLLAGLYPAFSLARFIPAKVLKGNFSTSSQGVWMRKSLVVFQFAVSIFLVIATLVITQQLDFIQQKSLGYDKEHVLVLPLDRKMHQQFETFKTELERNKLVNHVSAASESPSQIDGGYSISVEGMAENEELPLNAITISKDFIPTLDIQLVAGRSLNDVDFEAIGSADWEKRRYAFLINETAASLLGWTAEEAVGKRASMYGRQGHIEGVVKDFHFASLHKSIGPLALFPEPAQFNVILVKLAKGNPAEGIALVKNIWRDLASHRPFEYAFLVQEFEALYDSEAQIGQVFGIFASIAILIACLGLFGLSSFTAQQRAKEIGIRKVFGASVQGIVLLLSKDFSLLVVIATLVGLPVAWWSMNQWLTETFEYHIYMDAVIVLSSILSVFLVAWLTISYQSLKAAMANPIKTLKNE